MLKRSNAIRNGLILFVLLGLYFLLLDALGWADNIFLRLMNYVLIIVVLNNTLKHAVKNGENYLNKLFIGVVTVVIGIGLSMIALFIYLQILEPSLARYDISIIAANSYAGLAVALFIESLSSSLVLVFIMLQFYKNHKAKEVEV